MRFSSLLFSYAIIRKQKDSHEVLINLPRSWYWWPVTYRAIALDEDYIVRYDNVSRIEKDRLRFLVPDGWTFNILLYYKGWFGLFRTKELNIYVPLRLRAATNLKIEVLQLKNRYL